MNNAKELIYRLYSSNLPLIIKDAKLYNSDSLIAELEIVYFFHSQNNFKVYPAISNHLVDIIFGYEKDSGYFLSNNFIQNKSSGNNIIKGVTLDGRLIYIENIHLTKSHNNFKGENAYKFIASSYIFPNTIP